MSDSGITKEYLETILQEEVEKFEVKQGSDLGDGYMCAMLGVDVWRKSNKIDSVNPLSIMIKCYPANASRQEMLDKGLSFQVELGVYQEIVPELLAFQEELNLPKILPPLPQCIYGNYVPPEDRKGRNFHHLENAIVMPDLRHKSNGGFRLRDRFLGLDLDHYRLVIESQAILHALSWAYRCKKNVELEDKFPCIKVDWGIILKAFQSYTDTSFDSCQQILKTFPVQLKALEHLRSVNESVGGLYYDYDAGQEKKGHSKDTILKVPGLINSNEEPWIVLTHGDCWSNNMMFRYDEKTGRPVEVLFVDFQMSRAGDPFCDINYLLFTSGAPGLRPKHLESMLHVYYDTFTGICDKFSVPYLPGWSWQEFNRRMRRAKILGGFASVTGLPIMLKSPDELPDLDESADAVENSGKSNDSMENGVEFFSQLLAVKNPPPELTARLLCVMDDLIADGVC